LYENLKLQLWIKTQTYFWILNSSIITPKFSYVTEISHGIVNPITLWWRLNTCKILKLTEQDLLQNEGFDPPL
jgi:hypothetical protein